MTRSDARPAGQRRAYAARVPAEQRRAQLLDAALHLVATRGHPAVTMEAVADEVGVTKPVVYGHFRGRTDLLTALLRREHDGALQQLLAVLPAGRRLSGADPAQLLTQALTGFLEAVRRSPDRWYCIVMPMPDMSAEFHAAREQARAIVLRQAQRIAARLLSGHGTDAELAAHTVVTLFEMAARLLLTEPDRFTPDRFVAALRAVDGAIGPPPVL